MKKSTYFISLLAVAIVNGNGQFAIPLSNTIHLNLRY